MEDVHRLLQLSADRRHRGREDLLLPRRPQPGPPVDGADQTHLAPDRRSRCGPTVRPPVVRPRQGRAGLGRERPGTVLHLRGRRRLKVLQQT